MTWSVATPRCVAPPSSICADGVKDARDRAKGRVVAAASADAVEVAEELVRAVEQVDDHAGGSRRPCLAEMHEEKDTRAVEFRGASGRGEDALIRSRGGHRRPSGDRRGLEDRVAAAHRRARADRAGRRPGRGPGAGRAGRGARALAGDRACRRIPAPGSWRRRSTARSISCAAARFSSESTGSSPATSRRRPKPRSRRSRRRSTTTSATTCCASSSPPATRSSRPRRGWR